MTAFSLAAGCLLCLALAAPAPAAEPDWAAQRRAMVDEQIAARGVRDPRVLAAMAKVPRHLFVPPAWRGQAYADHPLPIGQGQTISQPFIVAHMTALLALKGGEKVLEVGTGSGYQAAVLAELAGRVCSIEIIPELSAGADKALAELGYANVSLKVGDGWRGWPEEAPFDAIMVTAAPEVTPPELVAQLKPGGRMVLPVGPRAWQELVLITKSADSAVTATRLEPVRFVPLVGGP